MKKLLIFLILIGICMSISTMAYLTLTDRIPADYVYSMNTGGNGENLSCTFTESGTIEGTNITNYLNITNVTLFSDFSGAWVLNYRNDRDSNGSTIGPLDISGRVNFSGRGTYNWYCGARSNNSNILVLFGANRTIFYRPAPIVNINRMDYSNISSITQVGFNVSATAQVFCSLHSNETGNYGPVANLLTVPSASMNKTMNITHTFPQGSIKFGVMCAEEATSYSNLANIWAFSSNKTITIDSSSPVIALSVIDGSKYKYDTVNFTISANDSAGISNCTLFVNNTLNVTNSTMITAIDWTVSLPKVDGTYSLAVICNDTLGNIGILNGTTFTVHTSSPYIKNLTNISTSGYCDRFNIRWQSNEASNATVQYGTSTAEGIYVYSPAFETTKTISIMFNNTERTSHFINVTACNIYDICNTTNITLTSPTKLCAGWNEFAYMRTAGTNLSDQLIKSNSDYIFTYNTTNQTWLSWTTSGAGNGGYNLAFGDVYLLYTSTDETFWRDTNGSELGQGNYVYNFSKGNNFIGIVKDTISFYNLSVSLDAVQAGNNYSFIYFSGWNNSAKRTVDYRFNWSWNNKTQLGISNNIESVWIWAVNQTIWNGTTITGVWS